MFTNLQVEQLFIASENNVQMICHGVGKNLAVTGIGVEDNGGSITRFSQTRKYFNVSKILTNDFIWKQKFVFKNFLDFLQNENVVIKRMRFSRMFQHIKTSPERSKCGNEDVRVEQDFQEICSKICSSVRYVPFLWAIRIAIWRKLRSSRPAKYSLSAWRITWLTEISSLLDSIFNCFKSFLGKLIDSECLIKYPSVLNFNTPVEGIQEAYDERIEISIRNVPAYNHRHRRHESREHRRNNVRADGDGELKLRMRDQKKIGKKF